MKHLRYPPHAYEKGSIATRVHCTNDGLGEIEGSNYISYVVVAYCGTPDPHIDRT